MFRISVVDTPSERRLVLEGKLAAPWIGEVEKAWRTATDHLQDRELVVDLTNVTFISPDGESTLLKLMKHGAKFSSGDVLTKYLLRRLTRTSRCGP